MPCVWLFAAVVLGEYEKDTVNAAAVSRPAGWIEGGVPTPTPRTRTTKSPTVKRARRRMIRPGCSPSICCTRKFAGPITIRACLRGFSTQPYATNDSRRPNVLGGVEQIAGIVL